MLSGLNSLVAFKCFFFFPNISHLQSKRVTGAERVHIKDMKRETDTMKKGGD